MRGVVRVGLVATALFPCIASAQQPPGRSPQATAAPFSGRWEYTVRTRGQLQQSAEGLDAALNQLGQEGWELVGIAAVSQDRPNRLGTGTEYYFKRRGRGLPLQRTVPAPDEAPRRPPAATRPRPAPDEILQVPPAPGVGTGAAPAPRPDGDDGGTFQVLTLKHAQANNLAQILNQLFAGTGTRGGFANAPSLRIVGDARTNSLLLRGTAQQLAAVEAAVARLDRPAENEGVRR